MDPNDLLTLALEHKWLALSSAVILVLVRLLKEPAVPYPLSEIPAKARPLVAVLLGAASGILEHVAAGTPWREALGNGLVAAMLAVLSHDVVIEWLRGGKELLATAKPEDRPTVPPEAPPTLRDGQ